MKALLVPVATLLLVGSLFAQTITELSLTERFGLERKEEPVRMGVPLAVGVAKDVAELGLADPAGKAIPCQFTEAMRWPDGSLRWVQLVFKASVPAKGKTVVNLVKAKPAASADKLTVAEAGGAVTVQNGFVKLTVKGGGFNLFDSLAFDPAGKGAFTNELVKAGSAGGIVAEIDGKALKSSADKTSVVAVEDKGTECVVVKATGHLADGAGATALAYTCRLHVYAGSPLIRVDFSYTNDQGTDANSKLGMKDLSLIVPVAAAKYVVGGEDQPFTGPLAKGESAEIVAASSDRSVIKAGGKELGSAKNKATKPLTIGWVGAAGAAGAGLAVSVRWFWQMFPKSLQASADGGLRVGLYSALAAPDKPLDVYMGQGRTHYLTFVPFDAARTPAALNITMAARQVPLRAIASPEYYCRTSKAFGPVADSDPSNYSHDLRPAVKHYDDTLSKSVDGIVKKIDGCTYEGVTLDSYGYNYFGDLFHWSMEKGSPDPTKHLWESNYYDYPWACCLQFARTGDEKYLDVTDPNGLHLGDVFMCKWDPEPMYRGACRYSPPADEVALDEPPFKGYRSVEFNHHKAQSMLARYLLLGDLQAHDQFLLALNNALKNPEESWGQCRGPGAKLGTLFEGFQLTRDDACLTVMKRIMTKAEKLKDTPKAFSKQGGGGYFMMGIAREGMLYWWQQTGDPEAVATVKSLTDFLLDANKVQGPQDSYPLAFCYRLTGEQKYRDAAVKQLAKGGVELRPKGFGMAWRSTPYAWYYLSNLAEADQPAKK